MKVDLEPLWSGKENIPEKESVSINKFEQYMQQTTTEYALKIQNLELLIIKLENQLLTEKLNKQNHSSAMARLEFQILKLENDLLKMSRNFAELNEENKKMQEKQRIFLEIEHKRSRSNYPAIEDSNAKHFAIITEHQSKIHELTEILRNQSASLNHMKSRTEFLEDHNRMLHEMILNQTASFSQIMQHVQDLSEEHVKQRKEISELRQKLKDTTVLKTSHPEKDKLIENLENLVKDEKLNKYIGESDARVWCTKYNRSQPICLLNTIVISVCPPFRRLSWRRCRWQEKVEVNATQAPDIDRVGPKVDAPPHESSARQSVNLVPTVNGGKVDRESVDDKGMNTSDADIEEKNRLTKDKADQNANLGNSQNNKMEEKRQHTEDNKTQKQEAVEETKSNKQAAEQQDGKGKEAELKDMPNKTIKRVENQQEIEIDQSLEPEMVKETTQKKQMDEKLFSEGEKTQETSKETTKSNDETTSNKIKNLGVPNEITKENQKGENNQENQEPESDKAMKQEQLKETVQKKDTDDKQQTDDEKIQKLTNKTEKQVLGDEYHKESDESQRQNATNEIAEKKDKDGNQQENMADQAQKHEVVKGMTQLEHRDDNQPETEGEKPPIEELSSESIQLKQKIENQQETVDNKLQKEEMLRDNSEQDKTEKTQKQGLSTESTQQKEGADQQETGSDKTQEKGIPRDTFQNKQTDENQQEIDVKQVQKQVLLNDTSEKKRDGNQQKIEDNKTHKHEMVKETKQQKPAMDKITQEQSTAVKKNATVDRRKTENVTKAKATSQKGEPVKSKDNVETTGSKTQKETPNAGKKKVEGTKKEPGTNKKPKQKIKKEEKIVRPVPMYMTEEGAEQREPRDCYDHYTRGNTKDGLFKIKPTGHDRSIQVFCDMKRGGWTVIMKRQDGTTNFYKEWDDYKVGFGGLYGEHWLGNDVIHYLTNQDHYSLRVDLMDWQKNRRHALYSLFLVQSENEGYRLHIDGYSGDAGDGFSKHDGHKFSTRDVDNDKVVKEFGGSCATRFHGAGWYYKCYMSNLNGRYYRSGKIPDKQFDGVTWKPWTGPNYSLKSAEMKIRPTSAKSD